MGKRREPSDQEIVRHFGISVDNAFEKRLSLWRDLATKPATGAKHPNSPRAARELCERAGDYLEWGQQMPDELQDYIVTMLRHVAAGGSADEALGIHRHPRLDALDQLDRDSRLAFLVDVARAQGMTKKAAIEMVAREYLNTDDETNLKRIYRRLHLESPPWRERKEQYLRFLALGA